MTPRTEYSPEQRRAAGYAAGALRVAALSMKRVGLDDDAARLFIEHDRLIAISGVRFERNAEHAMDEEIVRSLKLEGTG